ncbi:MAG: tetratricopeptide repeat protein [Deltaproteobacteria bacterium]|nr:tetratricopeptide repeat protein [Deltaproteobacteria bacterium]
MKRFANTLSCLAVLLTAGMAFAQPAVEPANPDPTPALGESARTDSPANPAEPAKVEKPAKTDPTPALGEPAKTDPTPALGEPAKTDSPANPAEPAKDKKRRPYTSTEFEDENMTDFEIENYGKIAKIREDSIKKMVDLVENTPNYPNFADVCYRIAEYMTENIKFRLALENRQYKKDLARFEAGELKEEPDPPLKDYSGTLTYYEKILVEHPKYVRIEEVLFFVGRNGVETGKALGDDKLVEKSVKYLNKLDEMFPKSQFLPKAYLLAAEYFFAKNNLFEALKYYKKLVDNHKDAPMYLYALYKLGWTYYNYQQYDNTLLCFQEVIQKLREAGREQDTLRNMTLKDYVITLSEAGLGWTSGRDFLFQEIGQDKAHAVLHDLADMLAQRGFYDDAVGIYTYFINLDVNSADAVDYWNRILRIYRFNFPFDEVEKKVRELRFFFRADGPWVANNKARVEASEKAADLLIKWDLSLAEFYLEEALYFNKGEDSFFLATGRFRDTIAQGAGKRLEQGLVGLMMTHLGLFRTASAGRVIFVAENVLGLAYPDDYKLPRKIRRMTLDKNETEFMTAKDQYLALPARTGQKPDLKPFAAVDPIAYVLYSSALIYYTRGMNEEGLADLDRLVAHDANSDYLGWAIDMIYQMSARAEDWAGLQKRTKAMLDVGNTRVAPAEQVRDFLCAGMINEGIVQAEKDKRYGDALSKLSTAAQTCADSLERGAEALYRLGEIAEKGGFIPQAKEAYQKVINEYGKSKYKGMAQRNYGKIKNK